MQHLPCRRSRRPCPAYARRPFNRMHVDATCRPQAHTHTYANLPSAYGHAPLAFHDLQIQAEGVPVAARGVVIFGHVGRVERDWVDEVGVDGEPVACALPTARHRDLQRNVWSRAHASAWAHPVMLWAYGKTLAMVVLVQDASQLHRPHEKRGSSERGCIERNSASLDLSISAEALGHGGRMHTLAC
eukprot:366337-Chlamydomonas_euryale.AAC.4